jgi:hypothetical protein
MMSGPRSIVTLACALALVACLRALIEPAVAQVEVSSFAAESSFAAAPQNWDNGFQYPTTAAPPIAIEDTWSSSSAPPQPYRVAQAMPTGETWIAPPPALPTYGVADVHVGQPGGGAPVFTEQCPCPPNAWFWQVLPDGLIYHSYWAGVHEPRLGILAFDERGSESFWDGTLGGRVGLLRYGTGDRLFPQGWQLDVEAAAMVRLTLDEIRDFEFADYRVGVPLTYGIDNWQFKFAVYHLSSHVGDEFILANPGFTRINYVRDAIVLGASYYPNPFMRLYSEAAYAVNVDGGAEPWEFQVGTELSQPGPTGPRGTPYVAINGHLREEHNFGGDINTQAGWLWRGQSGQVVRAGVQYFNGKSSQYQIFDESEQQIGFGLWYDY